MATALNLFPARIAFVNPDGTLTPEAYRALQTLIGRVGGALGDNGVDVFGDISSVGTAQSASTDTVSQMTGTDVFTFPDVVQTPDRTATPIEVVTVTGTPFTYTAQRAGTLVVGGGAVLLIEFIRGAVVALPNTYGEFPLLPGDAVRVTYSTQIVTFVVIPTLQFIPG